jgi:hypothetical protein
MADPLVAEAYLGGDIDAVERSDAHAHGSLTTAVPDRSMS